MKKLLGLFLVAMTATALQVSAQNNNDHMEMSRDVLKIEKKAAVAEAMQLSEEESKVFWPVYEAYTADASDIHSKQITLIKEFADKFENLSDEDADRILTNYLKADGEIIKLKMKYYKKFKKVVSAGKAARFMQIDNKIETLINASLALEIPLMEVKK